MKRGAAPHYQVDFGDYLRTLRRHAGDLSLDQVIEQFRIHAKQRKVRTISKSVLSLYERNRVASPKAEVLRILAEIYQIKYQDLARRWFSTRYGVALSAESSDSEAVAESLVLPSPTGRGAINLITFDRHLKNQAALARNSIVGVAATNFLDDQGRIFDLVATNLKRGVRYRYLLPEERRPQFDGFVQKLLEQNPSLTRTFTSGDQLRFIARPALSLPVSYVLYLLPDGVMRAYLSLPNEGIPQYYLVADEGFSMALYDGFRWSATLSEQYDIKRLLALLQVEVESSRRNFASRTLSAFALPARAAGRERL